MKGKHLFIAIIGLIVLVGCNANQTKKAELPTTSMRDALNSPSVTSLGDEIELLEYIPLKVTEDNASLIDGVVDYAITSKYIYVLVGKEARIVLFDRQGSFLRTFLQQGNGPDDFNGMIGFIQANEAEDRFYVMGHKIGVYTLEGKFIDNLPINTPVIYAHHLGGKRIGAISMPFMPFQDGGFGIGIFKEDGEMLMNKNDFYSPLVPQEDSGFTFGFAASPSDGEQESILFKMASNDTIFRLSSDSIQPAFVANLGNSDQEIIRGLNLKEIKKSPANKDIFVSDIFETPRSFYLRMRLDGKYYVASVSKLDGKTTVESCYTPDIPIDRLADINMQLGMVGSKGYKDFPIWGRVLGDHLIQVVTPTEVETFSENSNITVPEELKNTDVDENPIFIIYKLKNN